MLHAEADLISRVMAAMPSLFLLLSFESFLNQLKHGVQRSTTVQSITQLTVAFEQKQTEFDHLVQTKQAEVDTLSQEAEQLQGQIEQARATLEQVQAEIAQAKRVQSSSIAQARQQKGKQDAHQIEQRRASLLDILNSEGDIGATALADRLNISRGTVYSDLKALNKAGLIVKNGKGWEVSE